MRPIGLVLALAACTEEPELIEDAPTFSERVTLPALLGHLDALQAIADAEGATRVTGSAGYTASADYVAGVLEDAGYSVERDPFEITSWRLDGASVEGVTAFSVFSHSGEGDVTATLVPVDVTIPPVGAANSSTSGCDTTDFAAFPVGAIALIQRGSCPFSQKARHAEMAGAVAVVVFNEGQSDRRGVVEGTLDGDRPPSIPVVGVDYETGRAWAEDPVPVRVVVDTTTTSYVDHNVIARTAGGDPDRVLLVGAHLDSVAAGPGINDNGSGTALVLEMAVQATRHLDPHQQVAFAFWGAEESGLVGSGHWMYDEATGERDFARTGAVVAHLNFDMVASGNGYRWVYDGDGSRFPDGASAGSAEIERIFEAWFAERGLETDPTGLYLPSDSYWFVAEGIPTGGLFSGAFEAIDAGQAHETGAVAGESADPCYHQACDTTDRIDPALFEELAQAGAHAVEVLALRTEPLPATGRSARDVPKPSGCHDHVVWDR